MKRCKACDEEFEDKFSFCPVDATPLNRLAAAVVAGYEHVLADLQHSVERRDFTVTMIDTGALPERLANEVRFMVQQLKNAWPAAKRDPAGFVSHAFLTSSLRVRSALSAPNTTAGILTALALVFTAAMILMLSGRFSNDSGVRQAALADPDHELAEILEFSDEPKVTREDKGVGVGSDGRVGLARGKGEGSAPERRRSTGGGGGGHNDPHPAQQGRVPQPSAIPAPIPKFPPVKNQTLPVAGIDIDPALWKQLPMPGYGDPRSRSALPSNGPGEGGGMGDSNGTGIGDGRGPGFGPGEDGNIGGNRKGPPGGGGPGGSNGNNPEDPDRVFPTGQVTARARVISKPEPQYTEDARKNQITGTVVLRVVFSRTGQVTNIRALHPLPFGLTERAIAAARQIRFQPATKDGRPVNVFIQLEYNFNLY